VCTKEVDFVGVVGAMFIKNTQTHMWQGRSQQTFQGRISE
jgi:hypothetical protein